MAHAILHITTVWLAHKIYGYYSSLCRSVPFAEENVVYHSRWWDRDGAILKKRGCAHTHIHIHRLLNSAKRTVKVYTLNGRTSERTKWARGFLIFAFFNDSYNRLNVLIFYSYFKQRHHFCRILSHWKETTTTTHDQIKDGKLIKFCNFIEHCHTYREVVSMILARNSRHPNSFAFPQNSAGGFWTNLPCPRSIDLNWCKCVLGRF